MSGHSKWSTIKRQKGVNDSKRSAMFTKVAREIAVAARAGGGDPDANYRLRLAIDKARSINMPADNIKRSIEKATGGGEAEQFEEIVYEGYGPGGVAVLVEAATDNRNRTAAEVRSIFAKTGGQLAGSGFYDTVRSILRVNLTTIASGDVDSSGIIIFLSGKKRYVTTHTTLLLHMAGRTFDSDKRFTEEELGAMIVEDKLKDLHYASIVAAHTHSLTVEKVLHLMKANTVLTPEQLVELGLALKILE